jgi:hypothetical protein
MVKPSRQFVSELEAKLRMAYRAEFTPGKNLQFNGFLKFFIPATSGAFIVALLLLNITTQQDTNINNVANQTGTGGAQYISFIAGKEEEEIIKDFDNDELNQIDNGVRLAAAGNF